MAQRSYTQTEKAHAVATATLTSTKRASRELGIPNTTIKGWVKDPRFAGLQNETREAVVDELWVAIQVGIREVAMGLTSPEASLKDKAVALGILYDKHALLTGGATARSEARDITGTLSDADLIAAVREAERITGEGGAAPTTEGTPEG